MREFGELRSAHESLNALWSEASQKADKSIRSLEEQLSSVTGLQSGAGEASLSALSQFKVRSINLYRTLYH